MDKSCPKCKRGIAVKIIDTCLYCGADLPKELCLPEEQKKLIKLQRAKQNTKRAARRKLWDDGSFSGSGFDSGSGGDFGGD
jgi:hypothetical protein